MRAILISLTLMVPNLALAKERSFSIFGGIPISTLQGEGSNSDSFQIGWSVGMGLKFELSNKRSLQIDFLFEFRPVVETTGDVLDQLLGGGETTESSVRYFQIPVMVRFEFSNFYVGVGGYQAFTWFDDGNILTYSTSDIGPITMAGLELGVFLIEARASYSLTQVTSSLSGDSRWLNFQAFTGLRFGL